MRILIVEDDHLQAEWMMATIHSAFPDPTIQRISTEHEFRTSFEDIANNPPNIIIMGVMMPWARPSTEMPILPLEIQKEGFYRAGIRCVKLLSQDNRTRKTPIILYTVFERSDLESDIQGMSSNVVFLRKEADASPLIQLIRSSLQEKIEDQEKTEAQDYIALTLVDNKIKMVSLTPDGTYRFLDQEENLHSILYVYSLETLALQTAVEELESLINNSNAKEKAFQDFFERNPDFILGDGYKRAHPHITLTKDDGNSLIPDFVLEPVDNNSLCDLLELKLPTAQTFILQKNRTRFSSPVMEACAQLRDYSIFFDEERNRRSIQEKYGLLAYKPQMFVIIGRRGSVSPIEVRKMSSDLPNLHLLTYDDITTRMRAKIDMLKKGKFRR